MTAILGRGEDNAERRFELRDIRKSTAAGGGFTRFFGGKRE